MSGDVRARIDDLGLRLPEVSPPKGSYVPAVACDGLVFVSGQIPMVGGALVAVGRVGAEVSPRRAQELARRCALAALAAVDSVAGLDRVVRVLRVVGYVASAPEFLGQATVLNGASDLLTAVFGDAGRHARSAVGVARLPLDAPVEIELTVAVAT